MQNRRRRGDAPVYFLLRGLHNLLESPTHQVVTHDNIYIHYRAHNSSLRWHLNLDSNEQRIAHSMQQYPKYILHRTVRQMARNILCDEQKNMQFWPKLEIIEFVPIEKHTVWPMGKHIVWPNGKSCSLTNRKTYSLTKTGNHTVWPVRKQAVWPIGKSYKCRWPIRKHAVWTMRKHALLSLRGKHTAWPIEKRTGQFHRPEAAYKRRYLV